MLSEAIVRPAESVRAWASGCLPPLLDGAVSDLLYGAPQALMALARAHGSPYHLLWPDVLRQNVEAFRAVLHRHRVPFELFYGAKVNKSQALVRAAVGCGIGVDASSIYELRDALAAGVDPRRVCATGPAKTAAFHAELLARDCLISVDSVQEFWALERRNQHGPETRVLLRYRPAGSQASRFGMGGDELLHCLRQLAQTRNRLRFQGFHFHLGGYDYAQRVLAVAELAPHVEAARYLGLEPRMIDIGGGLPIRYVEADAYESYLGRQASGHYRNGRVPASFYPYGGRVGACEWLDRFLESPLQDGASVAQYLQANELTLAIEPGRSLADQTGISVFQVNGVKALPQGRHVIFVEGSSFSACETWFASEYLVDPILVSASAQAPAATFSAYIAGHSCLDDDVITNRLIEFPRTVQAGDLLVYANTAGYQMDLLENEFHRHPMPRRLVARCGARALADFDIDEPRSD